MRITSSTQIKLNFSETYSLKDGGLDKVAVSAQLGHQGDFALRGGGGVAEPNMKRTCNSTSSLWIPKPKQFAYAFTMLFEYALY